MNSSNRTSAILFAFTVMLPVSSATAQKGKTSAPVVALTDAGEALETKFAAMQASLKAEIEAALPKHDDAKIAAWLEAIQAEEGPAREYAAKAKELAKLQGAEVDLRKMEESLKYGPKTLEDAKAELLRAKARGEEDPEKEKLLKNAEGYLASRQKELDQLQANIEKARIAAKEAKAALPAAMKAAESAKKAHEMAMAATWKAMDAMGMNGILGIGKLDGKLAKYMVIKDATPRGLAEFAEKSPANEKLVQDLLFNEALMLQMLVADGPTSGKYGEAMKIYADIQEASAKAKDGVFQRLALAVSLGHAVPIAKSVNTSTDTNDGDGSSTSDTADATLTDYSKFIDPVKRYLSYEKWYEAGELDQGFKDLSVWNMVMTVNGSDPDEILAWGRRMLRTLRPDCTPNNGDTSIYVDVVDKEIRYGSGDLKDDRPEVAFMQNILANGGICGRRAFFGRFILQAFGIPTTARKEPGHATLAHWHPDGWATRLGGETKPGDEWHPGSRGFYAAMNDSRSKSYGADVNFKASSQARENAAAFMRVKRAQWIGALVGEDRKPGLITFSGKTRGPAPKKKGEVGKPIFWNELALHEQRRIIAGLESRKTASSNSTAAAVKEPAATGKVTIDAKGVITIPSAACSSPTESTKALYRGGQSDLIVFLDNKAGRTLLHLSRYAKEGDAFEYTFDAPKAGKYQLVADIATPKPNQRLFASANGGNAVEIPLPYTIGLWGKTEAVSIDLKAGGNVLNLHGPARATFDQFTLTPHDAR